MLILVIEAPDYKDSKNELQKRLFIDQSVFSTSDLPEEFHIEVVEATPNIFCLGILRLATY